MLKVEDVGVDFERGTWRGAAGRPAAAVGDDRDELRSLLALSERRYLAAGRSLAATQDGTV